MSYFQTKTYFETLEENYKSANSSGFNSSKPVDCEKCAILQNKVNYLISTTSKLFMGTTNLNALFDLKTVFLKKLVLVMVPKESRNCLTILLRVLDHSLRNPLLTSIV